MKKLNLLEKQKERLQLHVKQLSFLNKELLKENQSLKNELSSIIMRKKLIRDKRSQMNSLRRELYELEKD